MNIGQIIAAVTSGNNSSLAPLLETGLGSILDKTEKPVLIMKHPKSGELRYLLVEIEAGENDDELKVKLLSAHSTKTLLSLIK